MNVFHIFSYWIKCEQKMKIILTFDHNYLRFIEDFIWQQKNISPSYNISNYYNLLKSKKLNLDDGLLILAVVI